MATIAAYPEWYTRCGDTDSRTEITEVAIVSNYAPTGNEIATWDASAEQNGSVIAHRDGTKLTLVCSTPITVIPDWMFNKFMSLRTLSGFGNITKIGAWAFYSTPSIAETDINSAKLMEIGNDAFRLSSIEDCLDISQVPSSCVVGDRATRSKRWSTSLGAVQSVAFPSYGIYLDVPNADSQDKYEDVPYDMQYGEQRYMDKACSTFALYHIWNALYARTSKEYPDFITWFNDKLNQDGKYAEQDYSTKNDYAKLGWENKGYDHVQSSQQLTDILTDLSNGFPVRATILSNTTTGTHAIAIIGFDPSTKKLAIVDSDKRSDKGVVYWIRFEDVFVEGNSYDSEEWERVYRINYNVPILAGKDKWFNKGNSGIKKSTITEIEIVNSYTPTGSETSSWDVSAKGDGCVKAYVNGTKLTIAGNGDICIFANPDSSWVFSDSAKTDYFVNLACITGGSTLDTRNAVSMEYMFNNSTAITTIDTSNWKTSNVTSMKCMFQNCKSLTALDVSKWDTSAVTTMLAMFNHSVASGVNNSLTFLDVSAWDVSKVTNMQAMFGNLVKLETLDTSAWNTSNVTTTKQMFNGCESLRELDFTNWDSSGVTTASNMFNANYNLEKIVVGEKFSFHDAALSAPSATYITLADGNWYDYEYNAYAPADVQGKVARTYYASKFIAAGDDSKMVFVKNGTLRQIAVALRHKSGKSGTMYPSEFAEEVLAL